MGKYTPGPWSVHRNIGSKGEIGVVAEKAPCIIAIMGNQKEWPLETQANAALIAAAPELLEACRAAEPALWVMIATMPDSNIKKNLTESHRLLRTAIAKSETIP